MRWPPTSRRRVVIRLQTGNTMKSNLYHRIPSWVSSGSSFHIRIRTDPSNHPVLTNPILAQFLLDSARFYHHPQRWFLHLIVLMPDHLHGIISFSTSPGMSKIIAFWKAYAARTLGVRWQRNYFDHRLRDEAEFAEKSSCIRMNPVRAGLCKNPDGWPWMLDSKRLTD